jgi:hypothetical protein
MTHTQNLVTGGYGADLLCRLGRRECGYPPVDRLDASRPGARTPALVVTLGSARSAADQRTGSWLISEHLGSVPAVRP